MNTKEYRALVSTAVATTDVLAYQTVARLMRSAAHQASKGNAAAAAQLIDAAVKLYLTVSDVPAQSAFDAAPVPS